MQNYQLWKIISISLVTALILFSCSSPTPEIIEVTRQIPMTVVVTQVVTQIITPESSPTPEPTATVPPPLVLQPVAPVAQTTPESSLNPYTPLEECPTSFVYRGDFVKVSQTGGSNAIRPSPDLASAATVGYALPGEILKVIGGPVCSWGYIVWQVETTYGLQGWTPETNGTDYWLIPVSPSTLP